MLTIGTAMADFEYRDAAGNARRLSEAWSRGPAWILWMRHCGCQFYREAAIELGAATSEFNKRGLTRACVVQGSSDEADALCRNDGACDQCVPDPERRTFIAAGLRRAKPLEVMFASPELKARRRDAKAAGAKQDWKRTFAPGNDALQLPGAALVDVTGTVRYVHAGAHTGDLPQPADLLRIADETLGAAAHHPPA